MGLLVDLYQPRLPWRLTVNDGVGWDIADTFLNCVKEVSFIYYTRACSQIHVLGVYIRIGDLELLISQ